MGFDAVANAALMMGFLGSKGRWFGARKQKLGLRYPTGSRRPPSTVASDGTGTRTQVEAG
jgi:hypothetical protein